MQRVECQHSRDRCGRLPWVVTVTNYISDWHDLNAIRNDLAGTHVLSNNLDENTAGYDEHVGNPPEGWETIGEPGRSDRFTGTFDGNGHTISDLVIDRPSESQLGLFRFVAAGATVRNIGLVDVDVTGDQNVGGLAGTVSSGGEVKHSFVTGTIEANVSAGLLTGNNNSDVTACYAIGDVSSDDSGVLMGNNSAGATDDTAVTECYSAGHAEAGVTYENIGVIEDCYWDHEASDDLEPEDGIIVDYFHDPINDVTALTTNEITNDGPYQSMHGLDFSDSGEWRYTEEYPALYWEDVDELAEEELIAVDIPASVGAGSTLEVEFTISNPASDTQERTVWLSVDWTLEPVEETTVSIPSTDEATGALTYDVPSGDAGQTLNVTVDTLNDQHYRRVDVVESATLSGTVRDGISSRGIYDTTVDVVGRDIETQTESDGYYELELADGKTFELSVSHEATSFTSEDSIEMEESITVTMDGDTEQDIAITPELGGEGTDDSPYLVETDYDLQMVAKEPDAIYDLRADIDASKTVFWNSGDGFDPIGDEDTPFTGTFDGNRHVIEELSVDWEDGENQVGLFGVVGESGNIKDVSILQARVTGDDDVGAIVGENRGTVERSLVTGEVSGGQQVGGLIGRNGGTVTESVARVDVDGDGIVGGLVGVNSEHIHESYATGDITADEAAGGLVGANGIGATASVVECFSAGTVNSGEPAGGFVGKTGDSTVNDSYWDTETTGQNDGIGDIDDTGVSGLETDEMTGDTPVRYMNALNFDNVWILAEGYPSLAWENVEALPEESISDLNADSEFVAGETLTVTVTVENPADTPQGRSVWLRVGHEKEYVDEVTVELPAHGDSDATLLYDVPEDFESETLELTVETAHDESSDEVSVSVPEEVAVSATADAIDGSEESWKVVIDGELLDELTVEQLWTDWGVSVETDGGGVPVDDVGQDGTYTLTWDETQYAVAVELTVSPPERYVGGEYLVSVTATGPDETAETTATLEIA